MRYPEALQKKKGTSQNLQLEIRENLDKATGGLGNNFPKKEKMPL